MDPFTLALIGAGLLAAVRIKRGAAPPPRPQVEEAPEPEPLSFGGFPPPAFGDGRGLRPAVTHREVTKERNIEGTSERGERGLGEEPADVAPVGVSLSANYRAQEAIASGLAADVVGASTRIPSTTPTYDPRLAFTGGAVPGTQHPSIYGGFRQVKTR